MPLLRPSDSPGRSTHPRSRPNGLPRSLAAAVSHRGAAGTSESWETIAPMAKRHGIRGLWEGTLAPLPGCDPRRPKPELPRKDAAPPRNPRPAPSGWCVLDLSFPRSPTFASVATVPPNDRRWIYALVDPRDSTVRYVGMSRVPNQRFDQHCDPSRANYRARPWISELIGAGLAPRMVVLSCVAHKRWEEAERAWIRYFRRRGRLYNIHVGGRETAAETVARIGRRLRRGA